MGYFLVRQAAKIYNSLYYKNTDNLAILVTDLVKLSTFLYARQPNNRLTVLQCCVEDGVGITFNLLFLPRWRFVIFLHLFPFYVLQCLREDRKQTKFLKNVHFLIQASCLVDIYLCDNLSG